MVQPICEDNRQWRLPPHIGWDWASLSTSLHCGPMAPSTTPEHMEAHDQATIEKQRRAIAARAKSGGCPPQDQLHAKSKGWTLITCASDFARPTATMQLTCRAMPNRSHNRLISAAHPRGAEVPAAPRPRERPPHRAQLPWSSIHEPQGGENTVSYITMYQ